MQILVVFSVRWFGVKDIQYLFQKVNSKMWHDKYPQPSGSSKRMICAKSNAQGLSARRLAIVEDIL